MGVPKFYRWLSERYPKINQIITDSALLPEFDHLYLDMNGIIHGCTHPAHMDISDVLSEKDMMLGIMNYIDRIITQIVKPKVSVFMAIDGVAPRAKLNQQRSRRFRSAKDMADAHREKAKKMRTANVGDNLLMEEHAADAAHFDSNCITPGTEFMSRVSAAIQYFIRKKIKEDPAWRNLKVVFSGHEIPGEGEHKIMSYIRDLKSQPDYQPNTRHCMYGQDADLIMLGLVSHEPHFTLLREVVDFNFGGNKSDNVLKAVTKFTKQSDFQLLHLSILREYIQLEFCYGLEEGTFNLEAIIDDFVFLTFLVGNDFLPHLPSMDISDGAFEMLFDAYRDHRPQWGPGQYLTHAGSISDPSRLETFLQVVGEKEDEILEQREENDAAYWKKKRRWDERDGNANTAPTEEELQEKEESQQRDYLDMIQHMLASNPDVQVVDGWRPPSGGEEEKKDFKGRYYFEKLGFRPVDVAEHWGLRKAYIEGLQWCLAYYYKGCISWGWYFPYHYGPMLSDLIHLKDIFAEISFDLGTPLRPFEQLMGCLPPASSVLVPKPYRRLMMAPDSPILQFYPTAFEVDMNGKRNPWEGVNLLPFIDVDLLKSTIRDQCPDSMLTADEQRRNRFGNVKLFQYDPTVTATVPSCNRDIGLSDIPHCMSRVDVLEEPKDTSTFEPKLVPGTRIPYPGFPSLNVLPIASVTSVPVGLNVFGSASKYSTLVLTLHRLPQLPSVEELANEILGKSLFVNFPMMHEAKVVAVSDATCEVRGVKRKKEKKVIKFTEEESSRWQTDAIFMGQQYMAGAAVPGSGGVDIGDVQIRLKVRPLQGMKVSPANGSSKKLFGKGEAEVPLQMALWTSPALDPRFVERGPQTLGDRFSSGSNVILTVGKHRGCVGSVLGVYDGDKIGVTVNVIPPEPPFGLAIARSVQESYISSPDAAKLLKIHPIVFARITGSIFFEPGRFDLGLNLKYRSKFYVLGYSRARRVEKDGSKNKDASKANAWAERDALQVVGTKRADDDGNEERQQLLWDFTPKAIRLVAAFQWKFPLLFKALSQNPTEKNYNATLIFGKKCEEILKSIRDWLNNVETAKMPRIPITTQAMPQAAVSAVQRAADVRVAARVNSGDLKTVNVKVPSSALFREGSSKPTQVIRGSDNNQNGPPELGDRVANLCANGVPFGARGTVVSLHDPSSGCVEVVMDEEFIGGSTLQGTCLNFRGKLCLWAHLLRISAADSKDVVEQMIPAGSGKAAVSQVLTKTQDATSVKAPQQPRHPQSAPVESSRLAVAPTPMAPTPPQEFVASTIPPTAAAKEPQKAIGAPSTLLDSTNGEKRHKNANQKLTSGKGGGRSKTPDATIVTSRRTGTPSQRSGSGGRRRQGQWKEAAGPAEFGPFFSNVRGESGLERWKKLVAANKERRAAAKLVMRSDSTASLTAGLKSILGVHPGAGGEEEEDEEEGEDEEEEAMEEPPNGADSSIKSEAMADLKAILGVGIMSRAAGSEPASPQVMRFPQQHPNALAPAMKVPVGPQATATPHVAVSQTAPTPQAVPRPIPTPQAVPPLYHHHHHHQYANHPPHARPYPTPHYPAPHPAAPPPLHHYQNQPPPPPVPTQPPSNNPQAAASLKSILGVGAAVPNVGYTGPQVPMYSNSMVPVPPRAPQAARPPPPPSQQPSTAADALLQIMGKQAAAKGPAPPTAVGGGAPYQPHHFNFTYAVVQGEGAKPPAPSSSSSSSSSSLSMAAAATRGASSGRMGSHGAIYGSGGMVFSSSSSSSSSSTPSGGTKREKRTPPGATTTAQQESIVPSVVVKARKARG